MEPVRDDLRLLSIFHYVLAGFTLLFSCFPLTYIGVGAAIALGAFREAGPDGPPLFVGWIMGGVGIFLLVLLLAYGIAMIVAGRSLADRRRWLFCMIMAGISCPSFPFGTALGVFTLVVLSKPEVKALFTARRPSMGS
jgi:hypothetical protein